MERMRKITGRDITLYEIFATALLIWAALGVWMSDAVLRLPYFYAGNKGSTICTSTEYRFPDRFVRTMDRYQEFGQLYQEDVSTAIPGLVCTDFGEGYSGNMIPQGICVAGDYMLITAYDGGRSTGFGTSMGQTQNSVIYVMSNGKPARRRLLTTLVLPEANHVGGIAYDGARIWIARSTTGYCSAISYETLEEAVYSGKASWELPSYEMDVYCGVTASFVTYYQQRLWVGTYRSSISGTGELNSYRLEEQPVEQSAENPGKKDIENKVRLVKEASLKLPAYAQGLTFAEQKGETYAILSTSCGRYSNSRIYVYETDFGQGQPAACQEDLKFRQVRQLSFPPMMEELVSDGENTYVLFESAASCYSASAYRKCAYPVDRICGISNSRLLGKMD